MERIDSIMKRLDFSQESIVKASESCLTISKSSGQSDIVTIGWGEEITKTTSNDKRLALFYLCNDLVQKSPSTDEGKLWKAFKIKLNSCIYHLKPVRQKVERVLDIWKERKVYTSNDITDWKRILNGKKVEKQEVPIDNASTDSNGSNPELYIPSENCKELIHSLKTYKEWQKKVNEIFTEVREMIKKISGANKKKSSAQEIALECKIGELKTTNFQCNTHLEQYMHSSNTIFGQQSNYNVERVLKIQRLSQFIVQVSTLIDKQGIQ